MKIVKLLLISAALVTSSILMAGDLRGVKEVGILIEELDLDATKCNLSKDMIDASIRLPLSNSQIRIVKISDLPDSYLYAYFIVIDSGVTCSLYVELSYQKFVNIEKGYGQFWRKNLLLIRNKSSTAKSVSDNLEAFTKQFISAWLQANTN